MTPCTRGDAPELLERYGLEIARDYIERRRALPAAEFRWPRRENQSLLEVVRAALVVMTANHCSYCDGHPLGATDVPMVDHFRPKGRDEFYALVCTWSNLFLTCSACNKAKREQWDDALLNPDAPNYRFERYFEFRPESGELQPAAMASADEQQRARRTIDILQLNREQACRCRKRAFRDIRRAARDGDPLDYGYRFLIPLCVDTAPVGAPVPASAPTG
jgi:uncharacterized protein (TIGR02646 family)